jgi:L-iditol 2-dehydrogenase
VSLHGMELTGITAGGTVVVIGPGPIGLTAMRLARILGAAQIIAVGRRSRLAAARRLAADVLVDIEQQDPVAGVRVATGEAGADEVFEASGAEGTLNQAIRMVKPGGRIGLLGVPNERVEEKIPFKYLCRNEIVIQSVKANPNVSAKIVSLIGSGRLVVKDLVTHTFPLERFAEALDTFENRRDGAIKVVIEPNGAQA